MDSFSSSFRCLSNNSYCDLFASMYYKSINKSISSEYYQPIPFYVYFKIFLSYLSDFKDNRFSNLKNMIYPSVPYSIIFLKSGN
jgi:hypothetical protein